MAPCGLEIRATGHDGFSQLAVNSAGDCRADDLINLFLNLPHSIPSLAPLKARIKTYHEAGSARPVLQAMLAPVSSSITTLWDPALRQCSQYVCQLRLEGDSGFLHTLVVNEGGLAGAQDIDHVVTFPPAMQAARDGACRRALEAARVAAEASAHAAEASRAAAIEEAEQAAAQKAAHANIPTTIEAVPAGRPSAPASTSPSAGSVEQVAGTAASLAATPSASNKAGSGGAMALQAITGTVSSQELPGAVPSMASGGQPSLSVINKTVHDSQGAEAWPETPPVGMQAAGRPGTVVVGPDTDQVLLDAVCDEAAGMHAQHTI